MPFLNTDEVIAPAEAILKRAAAVVADDGVRRKRVDYLVAARALRKQHREVIRLANQKDRKPGETEATLGRQIKSFETLCTAANGPFGPIGFHETRIPLKLPLKKVNP